MKLLCSFLWKCQLRSTAMWIVLGRLSTLNSPLSVSLWLWSWRSFLIFCVSCRFKRRTHWVSECIMTYVCVCVCVCMYIDMVFEDNIVQAANMFSVTNASSSFNTVTGPYLNVWLQIQCAWNPLLGSSPFWLGPGVALSPPAFLGSSSPVRQICFRGTFLVSNTGSSL